VHFFTFSRPRYPHLTQHTETFGFHTAHLLRCASLWTLLRSARGRARAAHCARCAARAAGARCGLRGIGMFAALPPPSSKDWHLCLYNPQAFNTVSQNRQQRRRS